MEYIDLLKIAEEEGLEILENSSIGRLRGLYIDNIITINSRLETNGDIKGVLAEELGHHFKSFGDIRDQSKLENRKQEKVARAWGYERLVGIIDLVNAYKSGIRNRFELAEYLDVGEDYINDALNYYKGKYGAYYSIDNYLVYFDPLIVLEKF
jgi:hypothetical protein